MILYADSSALLKRVVLDPESAAVRALLAEYHAAAHLVTASSLAWLEVWRSLRRADVADAGILADQALSAVAEHPLTAGLLTRARTVGPHSLRSLDALHLTSAIAVGAETMLTYDDRLGAAASSLGLTVLSPA